MCTLSLQPGQRIFNGGQTFRRHKIGMRGNRSSRKLVEGFVGIFDERSAHEHLHNLLAVKWPATFPE